MLEILIDSLLCLITFSSDVDNLLSDPKIVILYSIINCLESWPFLYFICAIMMHNVLSSEMTP